MSNSFSERVYEAVRKIPRGQVATYGQIAAMAGKPGAARAVGNALHRNPFEGDVPCHRVVNAAGRLSPNFAFGGWEIQAKLLEGEGVRVRSGYVVDRSFKWK